VNHVYNEQYITNSNNTNSPSGHCNFLEPFDCSYMYQNPLRGTRLSKNYPYFCRDRNFALSNQRQKPWHEHIVSNSSSEKLSPSASAMTATMTLTMCFDKQITQGKIHDYFDTSKVYFTMPKIINENNELWLANSHLCCVGLFRLFHQRGTQKRNAELINNISFTGGLSKYSIACLSEANLKKLTTPLLTPSFI
jgi:hypothetical protein